MTEIELAEICAKLRKTWKQKRLFYTNRTAPPTEGELELPVNPDGPEAADKLEALSGRVSMQDRVIAAACSALDVADALIAVNLGLDTPKRWDDAMRNVAKSRAALAQTQSEG